MNGFQWILLESRNNNVNSYFFIKFEKGVSRVSKRKAVTQRASRSSRVEYRVLVLNTEK
jgi:hypothetical protein